MSLKPRLIHPKEGSLPRPGPTEARLMQVVSQDRHHLIRSDYFDQDVQCGEWTTYAAKGKVYKVTLIKPKKRA